MTERKPDILRFVYMAAGLFLLTLGVVSPVAAQSSGGSSSASFLRIGMGARSAGLGGAFTAVADDGSANYWNPAGLTSTLASSAGSELLLSHFSWLQDVNVEYAGFATRVNDRAALGASFTYLSFGVIEGYQNNVQTANLDAYDYSASVSLGYLVNDGLSLGISAKMVSEKLADVSATALAFDAGGLYDLGRVRFGAAFTNIGQSMKFIQESESLPAAARLGVAGYPLTSFDLLSAVDVEIPFDGELVVRSGLEYNFNSSYFLRGGYSFFPTQDERSFGGSASFGAGMRFSGQELNYAFSPEENLTSEAIHRFSLSLRF